MALLLFVGLAVLAENFGLELALAALAAGMMTGLAIRGGAHTHEFQTKLDAIGFGFLVPVFFISSGMKLDVRSIFAGVEGLKLLGVLFAALVAVRLPLVFLLRGTLGTRDAFATGLFSATTLSLVVALTQIAVDSGVMPAAEAAALVGAGVLTVLIFPTLGLHLASIKRGPTIGGKARDEL